MKYHPQLFQAKLELKEIVSARYIFINQIWRVLQWRALLRKMPPLWSSTSHSGKTKVIRT